MGKQKEIILDGLSAAQREAAETISCDVLVRAGAGSGKTKTLVARYLLLLDENPSWHPADITAVTFTRKAAREMQSRIRQKMTELVRKSENDREEKQAWMLRLNEMDSANIGTIHSLCGRILRAHPAEAGLDPAFTVLEENNAAMLIGQIVEETISRISSDREYEPLLNFYDGDRLAKILRSLLKTHVRTDVSMAVPGTKTVDYLKVKIREILPLSKYSDVIEDYREMAGDPKFDEKAGALAGRIRNLITAYDKAIRALQTNCHPADIAAGLFCAFDDWDFRTGSRQLKAGASQFKKDLIADFPFLKKDDDGHDLDWYKEFWNQYDTAEQCLRKIWPGMRREYMQMLDSMQSIDFDAMESLTLELLRTHPEIRIVWSERIKALLVDEYQDTNDAQAELFTLLDPSHNRLFAVGDKKQSIYGFRGTNAALFDRRGAELKEVDGKELALDTTYRTAPELLLPMGCLLEGVMADEALCSEDFYAAYEAMKPYDRNDENSDSLQKVPPYIEILTAKPENKEDDPGGEIVGRMLGERLSELMRAGLMRNWNDAAILCRNSKDFKQFEKALEAWQIPYVTVAGQGYYDRQEIRDILNTLRTAENPHENTALTGFLLSPNIGFTPEMTSRLFQYANKGGLKLSFYQALIDEGFSFDSVKKQEKLIRAREILKDLIRISGQVPLDESIAEACRLTGIRTMLALDPGDRNWLNLDKLILAARESGLISVSEFLDYLENIKDTESREGEAPSDDNGAVQIMTIHKAKGLEFPVTIIAEDVFKQRSPNTAEDADGAPVFYSSPASPRYDDAQKRTNAREKAEWLRLFYVAATRAKSRLILCGPKPDMQGKKDSWLKRTLSEISDEINQTGDSYYSAWGFDGQTVMIRFLKALPQQPAAEIRSDTDGSAVENDDSLLAPLFSEEIEPRKQEQTKAMAVGTLVHKGLELWRFPDETGTDPVLQESFRKILIRNDKLNAEEQKEVMDRAGRLLTRFGRSNTRAIIESTEKRWHEIPFSYPGTSFTVNGVMDLLMKDDKGYSVIDFKTDRLNDSVDLQNTVREYEKQIGKYRRAVSIILGEMPRCRICFLDYRGEVFLHEVEETETLSEVYELPEIPVDDLMVNDDGFEW